MLVLAVLLSALLHALWNAALKQQPDKGTSGAAVLAIACLTAAVVALGEWAATGRTPFLDLRGLAWSLGAGVFEGGYFLTLVRALERAPLGVAYTVSRGTAILLVWPISAVWLGEPVTPLALGGTALLTLGLVASGLRGQVGRAGLGEALVCGAFIAGYHLCYKQAMAAGSSAAGVFAAALGLALPINLARLGRGGAQQMRAALRDRFLRLFGVGLLCGGSFLLLLLALAADSAGFVLTLRNTSVLFALVLARAIGDRPTRMQVLGGVLVAAGAALLGLSRG